MKKRCMFAALVMVAMGCSLSNAQFKSQVGQESRVAEEYAPQSSSFSLFGWFDPEKFHMRHMVDFSYSTFGGQGMSMGNYTNSMMYEFANDLNVRTDISMSYSPFNSFPLPGGKKNDLSSIYLSRAELNYRPWKDVLVQFQYRQLPYGSYFSSPFHDPWYRESGF